MAWSPHLQAVFIGGALLATAFVLRRGRGRQDKDEEEDGGFDKHHVASGVNKINIITKPMFIFAECLPAPKKAKSVLGRLSARRVL